MVDQERREKLKKLGKKLGTDAILLVKEKSRKVSMASSFIKAGLIGSIDIPTILSFEVVSSKTGQTMYYQEQELVYTGGEMFIDNMSDEEVIEKIQPTIKLIINNFMDSFK